LIDENNDISDGVILQEDENKKSNQNKKLSISLLSSFSFSKN